MVRTYNALGIIRYDDKLGRCGKLLGLITFTDGKSLKVWDAALHQECKRLAALPQPVEVNYTMRHSSKWGDALETIKPVKAEYELYSDARAQDEQVGHYAKAGSFVGHRISKNVQRDISSDHETLMKRVG